MKIPITKPFFGQEERDAVLEPLESGWVVQGPKVQEFESQFSAYTGIPYALASTSCTTALHLALAALEIGPGDEVIVPSFTWVATANVVEMLGARPVLVDIDLSSFNVTVENISRAIHSQTKAILPVSLFGVGAPVQEIAELSNRHSIPVVEDAACALGSKIHGKHAGAFADIACFSFHARKVITTGEGGMLVTSNAKIADRVKSLRDHGGSRSDLERHTSPRSYELPEFHTIGYNYRMTDIQGAIGVAQMKRLPWLLEQRTRLASRYDEALKDVGWLKPQAIYPGSNHSYQSYVCLFQPETPSMQSVERLHLRRNEWMESLEKLGIATRPGTHAIHMLDFYRQKYGYEPKDLPNAYIADRLSVALPLYPQMTETEQNCVIDQIRGFLT